MKILLLVVNNNKSSRLFEEIGVGYLAAYLRQHNYEVVLMSELEDKIDYDKITNQNFDIIGFPVYASTEDSVCSVIRKIKAINPDIWTCIGGYAATTRGKEILNRCAEVNFAIKGEGELTLLDLVSTLEKGGEIETVKGIIYRQGGEIYASEDRKLIQDINVLPMPARDLLADKKYKIALISSSRGCTGKCSFCAAVICWKKWRGRNPIEVVDEIEFIVAKYGIRVFHFTDCSFEDPGICHERVQEFASEIVKRNLSIHYLAFVRASFYKNVSHDLMMLLKKSGLCGVMIGIEAANEFDLRLYNKNASLEDNYMILELFRKYDIHFEVGFIMFNPYSTFENIRQNIEYLEDNSLMCITNTFRMYDGCVLYDKLAKDNLLMQSHENNDFGSEYGYTFADKRILELVCYIKLFHDKNGNSIGEIHNIGIVLAYWKKIYSEQIDICNVIIEAEHRNKRIANNFNMTMFSWFKEILTLAENEWDKSIAEQITERLMPQEYIKGIVEDMMREMNILNKKLYRFGFNIKEAPFV